MAANKSVEATYNWLLEALCALFPVSDDKESIQAVLDLVVVSRRISVICSGESFF
jgi:hypothetical protein